MAETQSAPSLREEPSQGALKLARMEGGAAGELCERIAWMLDPVAFKIWERDHVARAGSEPRGPTWDQFAVTVRRGAARKMAASLVAGPLAGRLIDPTAQSEAVASARAEGERYKTALKLAMRLVQRCVGEGIVFEEDDPLPEMESWKVAEAIAETLGFDINSAEYVDLFKGPLTPGGRTDG